jgi:hypothetical protein
MVIVDILFCYFMSLFQLEWLCRINLLFEIRVPKDAIVVFLTEFSREEMRISTTDLNIPVEFLTNCRALSLQSTERRTLSSACEKYVCL